MTTADPRLTERRNPATVGIDRLDPIGIVDLINAEDSGVAEAVRRERSAIARAIELAESSFRVGGRLIYVGAGTSGRLGVLDAAEMPPTFGTDPEMVIGVIAGGPEAVTRAQEGAEDRPEDGARDMDRLEVGERDFVLGVATSGSTPFVHGALARARALGARTGFLLCTPPSAELVETHDVILAPLVGPEAIAGSTRMKAGTATKLVLNTISTGAMVRLGKVHGNLMVDLQVTCRKLLERGRRIVADTLDASGEEAATLLDEAGGRVKTALAMGLLGSGRREAEERLAEVGGALARLVPKGSVSGARVTGGRCGAGPEESVPACEFCGDRDIFTKYEIGDRHRIRRCRSCALMWLEPRPSEEELDDVYGSRYYKNDGFFAPSGDGTFGYGDYAAGRFVRSLAMVRLFGRLERFRPGGSTDARGAGLLDCGCGLGYLLDVAEDRGYSVQGIERNRYAVDKIRRKFRFPVHHGDVMNFSGGPFDVVTMLDLIEHLKNPFAAIDKVRTLLKPGGVFAMSTMDSDSLVSRLMGSRLEDFRRTREHLYFFNRPVLRAMLERAGFEILAVDTYGITLTTAELCKRLRLALPRIGALAEGLARGFRLSGISVRFDPRTKILLYARRT